MTEHYGLHTASINALIERMTEFDHSAKPYSMDDEEELIYDALEDFHMNFGNGTDALNFLCYIASKCANTDTKHKNAKRYVQAYVDSVWDCNMSEKQKESIGD